jgi:tetratricopeptide (TPR) repeat protein
MMANRIALGQEGRRLANRLEATGETMRAQDLLELLSQNDPRDRGVDKQLASIMRRTGNVDRLVERYLRRAEEAVADGRRRDAITWLREVLMLDRSRRDVARMIRDLQYEAREVKEGWSRRLRMVGIVLISAAMGVGLVYRELHVQRAYQSLEPAVSGDLDSLRARIGALDSLISKNRLWLGVFEAGRERAAIRGEIDRIEAKQAEIARELADRRAEQAMVTDAARTRGILMLEEHDFEGAAAQFEAALETAPLDWEHRARLEADIAAIEEFLANPDSMSGAK